MKTPTPQHLPGLVPRPGWQPVVSAFSTIIQAKIASKLAGGDTRTLAALKTEAAAELATTWGYRAPT